MLGNSPVMWTQSPEVLHATCLVDVSGRWAMVFHSLCEMRVMFDAVSICKRTGRLFSFTNTYFWFDFEFGRKVTTRLFVCIFLFNLCYVVACLLFCAPVGCRILFLCPRWLHLWQWCVLNGHFLAKCQPNKQMEVSFVLSKVMLCTTLLEWC